MDSKLEQGTIFIRYRRGEDFTELVLEKLTVLLAPSLKALGVNLFVDDNFRHPGEGITESVLGHLDRAIAAVLLLSSGFYNSEYISQIASQSDKPALSAQLSKIATEICASILETVDEEPSPASLSLGSAISYHHTVGQSQGQLHDVPPEPTRLFELTELKETIVDSIVSETSRPNPALGTHGPGGSGKSVVAMSVARDPQMRSAFLDGIYWINVGENADPNTLQAELCVKFKVEPDFSSRFEARELLCE